MTRHRAGLVAALLLGAALPAAAQGPGEASRLQRIEERLGDLAGQVNALESVARSGIAPTPAPLGGGQAAGSDERFRALTSQIAELAQRLSRLEARLGLAPQVGGGGAGPDAATRGAAPSPGAGEEPSRYDRAAGGFTATEEPTPRSQFDRDAAPSAGGRGGGDAVPFRPATGDNAGEAGREPPRSERRAALDQPAGASSAPAARNAYDAAYANFTARQYRLAGQGFQAFLADYPTDPLAAQAQFWLGETAYISGDFRRAADAFLKATTAYPNSDRAPESYLRLGMSLKRLGQGEAACDTFAELGRRFPAAPDAIRSRAETEKRRAEC